MPLALGAAVLALSLLLLLVANHLCSEAGPAWGKEFAVIGTLTAVVVGGSAFGLAFVAQGILHPGFGAIRPLQLGMEGVVLGAAVLALVLWRARSRQRTP